MMQLAELTDRRVTLQRIATEPSPFAPGAVTWSDIATVRASVRDVSDRERMQADELAAAITTRVVIRRSPTVADITPKDRLTIEGRVHDIVGIKETDRRRFFEITTNARID